MVRASLHRVLRMLQIWVCTSRSWISPQQTQMVGAALMKKFAPSKKGKKVPRVYLQKTNALKHPTFFSYPAVNEVQLHSHLGEGFACDYAINKCRHMLFGQRFVWVTDCYAIKFILSYEGGNSGILCLQMRLMCWDVDIVHRPDTALVDADYWSC